MPCHPRVLLAFFLCVLGCSPQATGVAPETVGVAPDPAASEATEWLEVDAFESGDEPMGWGRADTRNDTDPHVPNPQVTEVRSETDSSNRYLIKKPAADGIVGNRKALTFKKLPVAVGVGETYTFYTRIRVEYFPNNHSFGLSNLDPEGITAQGYDALEPAIRVTDKFESNGYKNSGAIMVKQGKAYVDVQNPATQTTSKPLVPGTWYELWYVVDNAAKAEGGQRYDLYVRGGDEFPEQRKVHEGADFRMHREQPLIYFMAICNTGPKDKPYGNGGLLYDDIYMARGLRLTRPN